MSDLTKDQAVEALGNMSVMELIALTKFLENKWGVEAKPQAVEQTTTQTVEPAKVEQTEFDVVLVSFPAEKKIALIKLVREILGLGLLESKAIVEGTLPKAIKEGVSKEDAEALKVKLAEAGGIVEIR